MIPKILVACERSQTVTFELRMLGYEAFSNDIEPCTGGFPMWHIQDDVFNVADNSWDMMIAHPPCTYISLAGNQWLSHPEDKHLPFEIRRPNPKYPNRREDMLKAIEFVDKLWNVPIKHIAVENPRSMLNTNWRKKDQIIHPWMFGDEAQKETWLWLKNLPPLKPTKIVDKGERMIYSSGASLPMWYHNAKRGGDAERRYKRSVTFRGIAEAMASQWGEYVERQINKQYGNYGNPQLRRV